MEYLVGVLLALAVLVCTSAIGFDRDRSFYPTVLIVVASYYDLFAVMGGSTRALLSELLGTAAFLVLSAVGFKRNMWRTKDKATNSETFLMSNMLPQVHALNAGPWKGIETYERELVAKDGKDVYVVAGGLFAPTPTTIGHGVAALPFGKTCITCRMAALCST